MSRKLIAQLEEGHEGASLCSAELHRETGQFRENLPVVISLASKALKERHWEAVSSVIGAEIEPNEDLTLSRLLKMNAASVIEQIQEVCVSAEKEYGLERNLAAMQEEWKLMQFDVKPYKETNTSVVGGIDEIIALLDDHIVKTQTMMGSMYIHAVRDEMKAWEHQLKYAQSLIDEWIKCQRTWMYLEPIFGSEDIMRQLPTEARRFKDVDSLFRATMKLVDDDAVFIVQANPEKRLLEKFSAANEKLDKIQKGLADYLEMKRLVFPRFFFLSDDQMLEILSQTKNPLAVQPHLGKAFEGVNEVHFEDDLKISQMISVERECVALDRNVNPEAPKNKGNAELWLLELENVQWGSIRTQCERALAEYPTIARPTWTLHWPAQVVLVVSQIFWTQDVQAALADGGTRAGCRRTPTRARSRCSTSC